MCPVGSRPQVLGMVCQCSPVPLCVSEAPQRCQFRGWGFVHSFHWEEAPGVNTFKALDGHIAKLLSHQAGQLVPPAHLYPIRPSPATQLI